MHVSPHLEQLREKSSSSRSRSAFTFSNSSRSILAWVTRWIGAAVLDLDRLVDELVGLRGLLGDGVDGPFEDLTLLHGGDARRRQGRLEQTFDGAYDAVIQTPKRAGREEDP